MNVSQLRRYCRTFPGSMETLYGEPWNFLVYTIGDLDVIVESPTIPRYSFIDHEIFTARIGIVLLPLTSR